METITVFFDAEALFVEDDGIVPVSEIACIVIQNKHVVDSFHLIVAPERLPETDDEWQKSTTVYHKVAGLSIPFLQQYGMPTAQAKVSLSAFVERYKEAQWMARDPKLENRILLEWGITTVHVKEVLDAVVPEMQPLLYSKHSRPSHIKEWAMSFQCGCHAPHTTHCALSDVMEEWGWHEEFRQENK